MVRAKGKAIPQGLKAQLPRELNVGAKSLRPPEAFVRCLLLKVLEAAESGFETEEMDGEDLD
jgi:hypothetical protein